MGKTEIIIWTILFVILLVFIVRRNKKFSKALHQVQDIIDDSREIFEEKVDLLKNTKLTIYMQKQILREMRSEEKRICELFSNEDKYPSQKIRMKRYREEMKETLRNAKKIINNY